MPVLLNTLLPAEQYAYVLKDCRARALFVSPQLLGVVEPILPRLADLENVVVVGDAVVVDVRDKDEWDEGHIPGATHMSRGTIELDIEEKVPDPNAMIICHCGGGGRSALAAETLQKMGYKNVRSMAGGFKAWKATGLPTAK